ncbi:MAG TPA: hypothetical protein VEK38_03795, partial [Candidatus Bathyarchaeia archaeon]|nr:hypothetical protein [Candidatus Bathyarchaeia archaeon]
MQVCVLHDAVLAMTTRAPVTGSLLMAEKSVIGRDIACRGAMLAQDNGELFFHGTFKPYGMLVASHNCLMSTLGKPTLLFNDHDSLTGKGSVLYPLVIAGKDVMMSGSLACEHDIIFSGPDARLIWAHDAPYEHQLYLHAGTVELDHALEFVHNGAFAGEGTVEGNHHAVIFSHAQEQFNTAMTWKNCHLTVTGHHAIVMNMWQCQGMCSLSSDRGTLTLE